MPFHETLEAAIDRSLNSFWQKVPKTSKAENEKVKKLSNFLPRYFPRLKHLQLLLKSQEQLLFRAIWNENF